MKNEINILQNGIEPEIKKRWGVHYGEPIQASLKRLWFFDKEKSKGKRQLGAVYDFNDIDLMGHITMQEIIYKLNLSNFVQNELHPNGSDSFRLWKGHVINVIESTLLGPVKNWFYQNYGLRIYHFREPRMKPNGRPVEVWVFRPIIYTEEAARLFGKHPHFCDVSSQQMESLVQIMRKRHKLAVKSNKKYASELGKALVVIDTFSKQKMED